ncbi:MULTISPECIES: hypothetical protein [Delftia]|uniref:hypothetical protein n=1 Tax=Delftia TaxID=80865 RepID=UPI00135E3A70|nr:MULTISPECIES: hypothetical protein [Delftia]MXN30148.1 hypothetical protein [Delftia sp. CH05]
MILTRALNRLICRVLIGMFLFAQLAVASYACPSLSMGSASDDPKVVAMANDARAMPSGCDQMDQAAANLCAEHCKFGQQNNNTVSPPPVMAPATDVLYLVPMGEAARGNVQSLHSSPPDLLATSPPHAILHCVFRI